MNSLPTELLTHVFEYLYFHDTLECSRVSRSWLLATTDDFLWIEPIQQLLPSTRLSGKNLRNAFIHEKRKRHYAHIVQAKFEKLKPCFPKLEICSNVFIIIFTVFLICIGGAWFGIFFGATYPAITAPSPTSLTIDCFITSQVITNYSCIDTQCQACTNCTNTTQSCIDVAANAPPDFGSSKQCCGGYHCCKEACETCQTCQSIRLRGKLVRVCSTTPCNCKCIEAIQQQLCTALNTTCTFAYVTCSLTVPINDTMVSQTKNISSSCLATDLPCMYTFLNRNGIGNVIPVFYSVPRGTNYKVPLSSDDIALLVSFTVLFAAFIVLLPTCVIIRLGIGKCSRMECIWP